MWTPQEMYKVIGRYLNTGVQLCNPATMLEVVSQYTGGRYVPLREGVLQAQEDLGTFLKDRA